MPAHDQGPGIWPVPMERIEATITAQLGPGQTSYDEAGSCFRRELSIYLAKHVGGWSPATIGTFYGESLPATVLHTIGKVELWRAVDESVDALLEILTAELGPRMEADGGDEETGAPGQVRPSGH